MDEIALARHGESEAPASGLVGGDTPLTAKGREEARTLGERLRLVAIDVCLTSRVRCAHARFEQAVERLERWCEAPAW